MAETNIMTVTWNRRKMVEITIPLLLSMAGDYNLYIWDNDSSDGTREFLSSISHPRLTKILETQNHGLNKPLSELWNKYSDSAYIASIHPDMCVSPELLIGGIKIYNEVGLPILGFWHFYSIPEDEDILAGLPVVNINGHRILKLNGVGGQYITKSDVLRNQVLRGGCCFPGGMGYMLGRSEETYAQIAKQNNTFNGIAIDQRLIQLVPKDDYCVMTRSCSLESYLYFQRAKSVMATISRQLDYMSYLLANRNIIQVARDRFVAACVSYSNYLYDVLKNYSDLRITTRQEQWGVKL